VEVGGTGSTVVDGVPLSPCSVCCLTYIWTRFLEERGWEQATTDMSLFMARQSGELIPEETGV
jgi:hypothetical protein